MKWNDDYWGANRNKNRLYVEATEKILDEIDNWVQSQKDRLNTPIEYGSSGERPQFVKDGYQQEFYLYQLSRGEMNTFLSYLSELRKKHGKDKIIWDFPYS